MILSRFLKDKICQSIRGVWCDFFLSYGNSTAHARPPLLWVGDNLTCPPFIVFGLISRVVLAGQWLFSTFWCSGMELNLMKPVLFILQSPISASDLLAPLVIKKSGLARMPSIIEYVVPKWKSLSEQDSLRRWIYLSKIWLTDKKISNQSLNTSQIMRNNHYVPQIYLKQWSNDDHRVWHIVFWFLTKMFLNGKNIQSAK